MAINGEAARYGVAEYVLLTIADILAAANWQRGGGRGQRPKPLPRPDPRAEKKRREYIARLKRRGLIKAEG